MWGYVWSSEGEREICLDNIGVRISFRKWWFNKGRYILFLCLG